MPTLANPGRFDHINISHELLLDATARLWAILSLEPEKYMQHAARHVRPVRGGPRMALNHFASRAICDGVAALVTGKRPTGQELPSFDFEYFAYCFSVVWEASSAAERKKYEGRLIMGLQNEDSFSHLYFELQVALVYLTYGCTVNLRDPPQGEPDYDLDVTKIGVTFCVEVKTVSCTTGLPMEQAWLHSAIGKLGNALSHKLDGWPAFRADVRFLGAKRPSHPELMAAFDAAASKLAVDQVEFRSELLQARISALQPDELAAFYGSLAQTEPSVTAIGGSHDRQGVVIVTTQRKWTIEEAIADVIGAVAKRQLPPGQHAVIWIQVVGLTALSSTPHEVMNEFVNDKPLIWKELNKRQDRAYGAPGLIGVHITGDAQLEVRPDKLIWIQLPHVFMTNAQFGADARMYRFLTMDKMEDGQIVAPRGAEMHYREMAKKR